MTIDQLSSLLDEIKGCIDECKNIKEENGTLKSELENIREQIKAEYEVQIQDANQKISLLETQLTQANNTIIEKDNRIKELEEQANLNLSKAQEIVNELKEIINA